MNPAFLLPLTALALGAPPPLAPLSPLPTAAARATANVHHILILDDSGSMESEFDTQGYGLAVPAIYDAVLGTSHVAAFVLAQQFPGGQVPRLGPGDYLQYPRENGTFYAKSVRAALAEAERQPATTRVEIALVTDAEPRDPAAKRALDQALAAHPNFHFRCVQLGTNDPGDLCAGPGVSTFAHDGFELARVMTEALAASLGSIPRWGKAAPGQTVALGALGPYVKRAHVLLLGARAGDDFAASVVAGGGQVYALTTQYTRPIVGQADIAAILAQVGNPGLADRRLALATLSLDAIPAGDQPWNLRFTKADGPVAWGLILEYDLTASLSAPASLEAGAKDFEVRSDLGHAGVHLADAHALDALGLVPKLTVTPQCTSAPKMRCPDTVTPSELAMVRGGDGYATVRVPADPAVTAWDLVVHWVGPTADLTAAPATTTRETLGRTDVAVTPTAPNAPQTPPIAASPTLSPATGPVPTPPIAATPSPAAPPTPAQIAAQRWIPPTLDLPDWTLEHTALGYTLTVHASDGHTLTGAEISAEKLTAALVVDGVSTAMQQVGDHFAATLDAGLPGARKVQILLGYPGGSVASNDDHMDVLPDAAVRLPATTDYGDVDAGCDAQAACQVLDLSQSRRLAAIQLRARRLPGVFEDLQLTLRRGTWTHVLTRDAPVLIPNLGDPITAGNPADAVTPGTAATPVPLELCWAPPGCNEAPVSPHELLVLEPADPRLQTPDRTAQTRLTAVVIPSTWLHCNLWWLLIVGGGILFFLIVWGYTRPHAFPAGAMVQVADHERRLARDPGRPLRVVPCGRRGFYRTATCAFDPSGFTVKKTRPHVVLLRAERGAQIALVPRGATLERRQRGAWVPVDRTVERHVMAGAVYRVNQSFFFKVMA